VLRHPEYGRTLGRIADGGAEDFYRGGVARDIAAPVRGTFRELPVYSSPPPAHGTVLLAMLNLVEGVDLAGMTRNSPEYVETVAWATRTAFADCVPYLADPRFATVPVEWLISKERARVARRDFALETGGASGIPSDGHTTHMSVADADGDVVSITHSIGSIAGAGVMTPSLGFLHNNFLGHFNPLRGYHNSIGPGRRMGGGSPTIVYRDGRPWIAIGSSGGSRLISAVFQTLLNVIVFEMPLQEAVSAPRIHSESGRKIYVEPAFSGPVTDALRRRGYEIEVTAYMGCNQAVAITADGVIAASDPRGGQGIALWPR
jgi:gamma-glutamyltranspeptidase/glutathione hydrolase